MVEIDGLQVLHHVVADITADWTLYAFNSRALAELSEMGVKRFVASPENNRENLQYLAESGYDVEFLTQQSTPLFVSLTKPAANPAELMDFDMHLLLAAIAPRKVLVEGFGPSNWMDTKAEFLACQAASAAWEFLGLPGLPKVGYPDYYDESAIGPYLGYVRRTEGHGISGYDWNWMLDFADRALGRAGGMVKHRGTETQRKE